MDSTKHRVGRLRASVGTVGTLLVSLALAVALCLNAAACSDAMGEARALEDEGDLDGAVALYEELLRTEPESIEALSAAAVDLLILGRFDEALPLQERVVALDVSDVQTRIDLGFNYLNHQGRPADAVRVLGEAASLDPSAKNLCFFAQAQMVSGDPVAAEETMRRAIATDPGYGRSYDLLAGLLRNQGRGQEAAEVVDQATAQGITLEGS